MPIRNTCTFLIGLKYSRPQGETPHEVLKWCAAKLLRWFIEDGVVFTI